MKMSDLRGRLWVLDLSLVAAGAFVVLNYLLGWGLLGSYDRAALVIAVVVLLIVSSVVEPQLGRRAVDQVGDKSRLVTDEPDTTTRRNIRKNGFYWISLATLVVLALPLFKDHRLRALVNAILEMMFCVGVLYGLRKKEK